MLSSEIDQNSVIIKCAGEAEKKEHRSTERRLEGVIISFFEQRNPGGQGEWKRQGSWENSCVKAF